MKKRIFFVFLVLIVISLLNGCGVKSANNIMDDISNKYNNSNSYYLDGVMEIYNNENVYSYDVKVSYKKNDYYKIDLVNTLNNHRQVILKNDEGVYVVTPSLNKSFKFQSDWPYNNSQVYLLGSIIEDISLDDNRNFKAKDNSYYFVSKVNYPNNKALIKQNVYFDKKLKIKKVEVVDKNGKVQIKMKFNNVVYNKKFDDDYFELSKLIKINNDSKKKEDLKDSSINSSSSNDNSNVNNNSQDNVSNNSNTNTESSNSNTNSSNSNTNSSNSNTELNNDNNTKNESENQESSNNREAASINDVIYPMYLPNNTTLANKEVVNTDNGERLILTFSGDNPFVLVEETLSYSDSGLIIPVSGNLDFLNDVIGVINDNSVTFESNGIGYYIVSDKLEKTELVNIARSISVLPVSK